MNFTESGTTTYKLQHCTEPGEYHYEVRIASEVRKGKRSFFSGMKMRYVLQCQGYFNTGTLRYRLFCKEKVPVDPKGFPLKKLSKAMQLALRITAINDDLVFHVSPAMKILQLENPEEVREKWKGLRPGLESRYPDLGKSITDFEWQLKDENIQRCYTEDTLFRFLFPAIFETSYSERFREGETFMYHNAIEEVSLPVAHKARLQDFYRILDSGKLEFEGVLQADHKDFPRKRLNMLLGELADEGSQHSLIFENKGYYDLKPRSGIIKGGAMQTRIAIGRIYKKETEIDLKLLEDE